MHKVLGKIFENKSWKQKFAYTAGGSMRARLAPDGGPHHGKPRAAAPRREELPTARRHHSRLGNSSWKLAWRHLRRESSDLAQTPLPIGRGSEPVNGELSRRAAESSPRPRLPPAVTLSSELEAGDSSLRAPVSNPSSGRSLGPTAFCYCSLCRCNTRLENQ
jgi:hypothetical protein